MTHQEAENVAKAIVYALPSTDRERVKGVDVIRRLHAGMLTIRVYFVSQAAGEPEPFIFKREELLPLSPLPDNDTYYRCAPCQRTLPVEEGDHCWRCGYKATRLTRSLQTRG